MNWSILRNIGNFLIALNMVVTVTYAYPPEYDSIVARRVVSTLEIKTFKSTIKTLSDMGDRKYGSSSNLDAQEWLQNHITEMGYKATLQSKYKNIMFTKVGTVSPDSCYIIGAHYDGRSGGGAADDNASGVSLILETARVLVPSEIKTHYSIRFICFNCEETGISGSKDYVRERESLQGKEDPAGSGMYPEPRWLGMASHDLILYDHGVPWQKEQIPKADIDVEYKAGTKNQLASKALANEFVKGCKSFSTDYPAELGSQMTLTDSEPFKNKIAAVSVRENRRATEIEKGNPHYHKKSDLYETYSEKDFLFGLNTVQMTVGTMCRLAGVHKEPSPIKHIPMKSLCNVSQFKRPMKEVLLFDALGRKIFHYNNPAQIQNILTDKTLLPKGVCIMHINDGRHVRQYTFLHID